MRKISFLIIISMGIFALAACGSKPAENVNSASAPADAEAASTSQFKDITDANVALAEGNRLLDDNQTELAIEAYKRALEIDPDLGEPYFHLGVAYALLESEAQKTGEAEHLPGDMTSNKNQPKPNSIKMFEKAVEVFKKQIGKNSKDAAAHFYLGLAYNKLNKDEDAEKSLEEAVKLNPEDFQYQTELGAIRVKLAKYHEAIAALKKAVDLAPDDPEAADLLEEAQAGARRVDYVSPKTNSNSTGKASNSNSNTASNSAGSSTASNTKTNSAPPRPQPKDQRTPERPRVVKP